MSVTVQTTGFAELARELEGLGKQTTQKASLRRALRKAAEPMAEKMRAMAPVRSGHLRDSIHVGTRISGPDAGRQAFGRALRDGGSRQDAVTALRDARRGQGAVLMYIGPGQHPQGIFKEFGTFKEPPQPFMRPAWDSDKMAMLDRLKTELWADIQRTVARAERRAARLAARG